MRLIKKTDNPAEIERLIRLVKIVYDVPETRVIMDLGRERGCKLYLDPDLPAHICGYYTSAWNTLRLNPIKKDRSLILTLAHELRHLWQDSILNISDEQKRSMTKEAAIIRKRTLEGDAMTFEYYIEGYLYNENKGGFSYNEDYWLKGFFHAQDFLGDHERSAADFCTEKPTIDTEMLITDLKLESILCKYLDLNRSYWTAEYDLRTCLLKYIDPALLEK